MSSINTFKQFMITTTIGMCIMVPLIHFTEEKVEVVSCRVVVTRYLVANNDFASIMVGYVTVDGRQQRNAPYERDGYFYGPFPAATVKADNYEPVEEIDMYKLYSDGTQATITNYKLCLAEINK